MEYESFIYKWTHIPTGRYYIGKHKGHPDDGYTGSGVRFQREFKLTPRSEWVRELLFFGTDQEVLTKEAEMVTEELLKDPLCLNMVPGGGQCYIWKPSKDWVSMELWHPIHGEYHISKDLTVTDLALLIYNKGNSSTERRQLSRVLGGLTDSFDRWELRDAQLAQKVKTWLEMRWDKVYLKTDNEVVLIYLNGKVEFAKSIGQRPQSVAIRNVIKGVQHHTYNWYLATQEEYEANPGRVFGTPEEKG